MRRRLLAIIRKEFIHILRDFRSLMIILLMPILMIVLYGYGITLDMRNIPFAVIDDSNTPESRALVRAFGDNGFFRLVPERITRDDVERVAGVEIRQPFEPARLRQKGGGRELGGRPRLFLPAPLHPAEQVDSPRLHLAPLHADALEGNPHLHDVAVRGHRPLGGPDKVL